ncbi:MAG: DUF3275 family protein [Methyloglobulus sp.]|nr:DUF3275 family protein [Methyloglobulus sp.]
MIKVSGVLHIKVISGRNGDFRVGRLVADIGEFAVKDAELDQYEEGRYEGEFGISQISPSYYSTGGRLVVEVRARLGMIDLASVNDPEPTLSGLEQDPLDEPPAAVAPQEVVAVTKDEGIAALETETDAELFGLLWPLASPLKLDPTVDRNVFRKQRDRLKALGYTFEPIGQQWLKG